MNAARLDRWLGQAYGGPRGQCSTGGSLWLCWPRSSYDYLAWLFNHDQITLESAKQYWGPDMLDVYALGRKFTGPHIDVLYAELAHFERTVDQRRPPDPCG
jgi:hypothetical protein